MLCLGIETSCDESALALVRDGRLLGSVLASQADLHALFGGVVPELASREHYRFIGALYDDLMGGQGLRAGDLDVIAVTRGPGLLGALLVGVAFAKGLALGANRPLVAVNHLHAHLLAVGLEREIPWPALGLLVSGGHTHLYRVEAPDAFTLLGRSLDDAAGEACDKFAKMLGLTYPGGAVLDALACRGEADPALFPRPCAHTRGFDFSFSGLKTAGLLYLEAHPEQVEEGRRLARLMKTMPNPGELASAASGALCRVCASYMLAVAETLRLKTERALHENHGHGTDGHASGRPFASLLVAGGVAASARVRAVMSDLASREGLPLLLPSPQLCTDNAAMVAHLGWLLAERGLGHGLDFAAVPRGQALPEDAGHLRPAF